MADAAGRLHSRVALRDRSFADVIDLSFAFLRESHRPLGRLAAVALPLPIVGTIAVGELWDWAAAWWLAIAFAPFVSAPFTVLFGQFVFEDKPAVRVALKQALRAAWRTFVVQILLALATSVAFAFLVLPVLWVAQACFFVNEAVLLERATIRGAFRRSSNLGARAGGETLMGSIVLGTLLFCGPMLAHQIGTVALEHVFSIGASGPLFERGGSALAAIGFWLTIPYVVLVRFLFYINVRTRTEGWDIQTAFATIVARAEAEAGS